MRIKEFDNYKGYISQMDLANIFDVNIDKYGNALYNLNDSLVLASTELPRNKLKTYIPKDGETPLLVAYNLYNNIRLYWIILKLNNISNSFYTFTSDDEIKYLDYSDINAIIKNM